MRASLLVLFSLVGLVSASPTSVVVPSAITPPASAIVGVAPTKYMMVPVGANGLGALPSAPPGYSYSQSEAQRVPVQALEPSGLSQTVEGQTTIAALSQPHYTSFGVNADGFEVNGGKHGGGGFGIGFAVPVAPVVPVAFGGFGGGKKGGAGFGLGGFGLGLNGFGFGGLPIGFGGFGAGKGIGGLGLGFGGIGLGFGGLGFGGFGGGKGIGGFGALPIGFGGFGAGKGFGGFGGVPVLIGGFGGGFGGHGGHH